jgi:RNA polymerase subunit RPABC4/transcription elongation factor Spt4
LREILICCHFFLGHGETSWCFSQVKGALNDDITDADVISCVEFNHDGDLLATGDKGGRVVIFQVKKSKIKKKIKIKIKKLFAERSKFKGSKSTSW